jgi:hypothetical protein
MYPLIIAVCAFVGSLIAGVLGWLKSGENFVARQFMVTVMSGIGGAILIALAYAYSSSELTIFTMLEAVLAGMGVDVGVNRISGAIAARANKPPVS